MKKTAYILTVLLLMLSCTREELYEQGPTPFRQDLIGRAVDFSASVAGEFTQSKAQTAYTSYDNGKFNQNDRMRIYRNYWDYEKNGWSDIETYRTYHLKYLY